MKMFPNCKKKKKFKTKTKCLLCDCRKYPYHLHRRDLLYDPSTLLDFPKSAPKDYPHSPLEFLKFLHTRWKYCNLLLKGTDKYFCSLGCQILLVSGILCRILQHILKQISYANSLWTQVTNKCHKFHVFSDFLLNSTTDKWILYALK